MAAGGAGALFPGALISCRVGIFLQGLSTRRDLLRGYEPHPPLPCAPTSRSWNVHYRGKSNEFPRGTPSQRQLSQRVVLILFLRRRALQKASLPPSTCPEPAGTAVPCSTRVTEQRGPSMCSRRPTTHLPAPEHGAKGDRSLHPSAPWPASRLEPASTSPDRRNPTWGREQPEQLLA